MVECIFRYIHQSLLLGNIHSVFHPFFLPCSIAIATFLCCTVLLTVIFCLTHNFCVCTFTEDESVSSFIYSLLLILLLSNCRLGIPTDSHLHSKAILLSFGFLCCWTFYQLGVLVGCLDVKKKKKRCKILFSTQQLVRNHTHFHISILFFMLNSPNMYSTWENVIGIVWIVDVLLKRKFISVLRWIWTNIKYHTIQMRECNRNICCIYVQHCITMVKLHSDAKWKIKRLFFSRCYLLYSSFTLLRIIFKNELNARVLIRNAFHCTSHPYRFECRYRVACSLSQSKPSTLQTTMFVEKIEVCHVPVSFFSVFPCSLPHSKIICKISIDVWRKFCIEASKQGSIDARK